MKPNVFWNFAFTPSSIPTSHLVSSVEAGLRNIPRESASNLRAKIVNALWKPWYPAVNLKADERRVLKALKQSEDVVILSVDKCKATVVMDRKEYDEKLLSMLKDATTYKKLSRDPAPELECRMNYPL